MRDWMFNSHCVTLGRRVEPGRTREGPLNLVLVTGAAGFIGSHLSRRCSARAGTSCAVDAFTSSTTRSEARNIARLRQNPSSPWSTSDLSRLVSRPLVDGVDAVVHLAGEPGVCKSWGTFSTYVDRNVLATQRLSRRLRVPTSRAWSTPRAPRSTADAEAMPSGEAEPRPYSPYGVSKLAAECLVGAYAHSAACPDGLAALLLGLRAAPAPRHGRSTASSRRFSTGTPGGLRRRQPAARLHLRRATSWTRPCLALSADLPRARCSTSPRPARSAVGTLIGLLRRAGRRTVARHRAVRGTPGDVPRTEGNTSTAQLPSWSPTTDCALGSQRQVEWHRGLREPLATCRAGRPAGCCRRQGLTWSASARERDC